MSVLVPILFFLSGLTALIYQMVWMRELVLVFGASMFAISTLLTAFMGGLALGSWVFGLRADRYENPLRVYALLELGIGAYAFLVPLLFTALIPIYQSLSKLFEFNFYIFSLVRFVFAVLILVLPTALMGGTLPVLAQRYKNRASVGKGVGLLYAFNTLGAVIGVLLAGFFLLPSLGLQKTTLLSVALNGLIALLALFLGRRETQETSPVVSDQKGDGKQKKTSKLVLASSRGDHRFVRLLMIVFAVSGFSAMIYEVVWTRILTLILGSTVYSYATMLSTYLLGLALGTFIFSLLLKRFSRPLLMLTLVQGGIALFAFFGEFIFPMMPSIFMEVMAFFHTWSKVRAMAKFIIAGAVMVVPTLLMGGVFPLVIHLLTSKDESERRPLGSIVGMAYAMNTVGTIFGSFTIGFILLPLFGIQKSLHIAIMINAFLALALWFCFMKRDLPGLPKKTSSQKPGKSFTAKVWASGGVLAFLFLITFLAPVWNPLAMSSGLFGQQSKLKLLFYEEGISATVTVVQHQTLAKDAHLTLAIDGKPNASTTGDMKTQLLVAHLPMLLAKETKDVMLIGHGSGITTGSMTTHPITRLITLELEPEVISGSRFFDPFSHNVLDDDRVILVEDDARNYLLRTDEDYDVIVSEPSHPWRSGSAKLFTQEFFQLGKRHLRSGGVFSQWIHFYGIRSTELKSVIKTFHSVFEYVLIFYTDAGDLIMLGSEIPFNIDRKEITRRISQPAVAEDLARANVYSVYDLWAHFMLGPNEVDRFVGDATLNTDDFTLVEFQTPKSLFEDTMSIHIAEMRGAASAGRNYLFTPDDSDTDKAAGYYAIAKGFFGMDKFKEAKKMIRKGRDIAENAEGRWLWGRALFKEEDRLGAEHAWLEALEHNPSHQQTLLSLAIFYQSQGAYKKASSYLAKIADETVIGLRAAYYKGVSHYFKGEYEDALAYFLRGRLFSEPFVYYYQNLAYKKLGKTAEAKRALGQFIISLDEWRRELELEPKKFKALLYLKGVEWRRKVGILIPEEERMALIFAQVVSSPLKNLYGGAGLYLSSRYPEAIQILKLGIEQLGRQASGSMAFYYLGLSYQELGDNAAAGKAFSAFVKNHSLDEKDIRVIEARKYSKVLSQVSFAP